MASEVAEALRLKRTDFGSGWYHDSAIEEAGRDKKNDASRRPKRQYEDPGVVAGVFTLA